MCLKSTLGSHLLVLGGGGEKHYLIYHSGDITEKSTPLESLWTSVPNAIQIPSLQGYPLRMKQGNTCFHWAISQPSTSKTDIKSAELAPSWCRRASLQKPGVCSIAWDGLETSQLKCAVGNPHTTSLLHAPILSKSSNEHVQLGFKRQLSLAPKTSVMISDPPFISLCMAIFRLCELRRRTHHLCDLRFSIRSNTVKPSSAKVSNTWQARCSACGFIKRPVQWL